MQIWQNEAGKHYHKLVIWKTNENFPSLGICHFIWYPHKKADIFSQTFPDLLAYFKKKKVNLPTWLKNKTYAPWKTKDAFDAVAQGAQVQELRKLMFETIDLQIEFLIERFEKGWPRILKQAASTKQKEIQLYVDTLMKTAQGTYALLDYLNFKGEGTNPEERYQEAGWGLLQVLEGMTQGNKPDQSLIERFITSAKAVLSARVAHTPPAKAHEKQWLQGWFNRVDTYLAF